MCRYYDGLSAKACVDVVAMAKEWYITLAAKRYVARAKAKAGVVLHQWKHEAFHPMHRRKTVRIGVVTDNNNKEKAMYVKI